jgi:hypothetical protein
VSAEKFDFASTVYGIGKRVCGAILNDNTSTFEDFVNLSPMVDIIYTDQQTDAERIREFVKNIAWYTRSPKTVLVVYGAKFLNLYRYLRKLLNLPSNYSGDLFVYADFSATKYGVLQPLTFVIVGQNSSNIGLTSVQLNLTGSTLDDLPINKLTYARATYRKTLTNPVTVPNGSVGATAYNLSANATMLTHNQNYILGSRVGDLGTGAFNINGALSNNGRFFINFNREVEIDIIVRLDIALGSLQNLRVQLRRGDGTLVKRANATVTRSPDGFTDSQAIISTFSFSDTDQYVTSGYEVILENLSGTTITLPAQDIDIITKMNF